MLDDGPVSQAVMILVQAHLDNDWEQGPAKVTRALASCRLDCSEVFSLLTEEEKPWDSDEIPLRIVEDCLRNIRRKYLQLRIADLRKMLAKHPEGAERDELLHEFMNLTRNLASEGKKEQRK